MHAGRAGGEKAEEGEEGRGGGRRRRGWGNEAATQERRSVEGEPSAFALHPGSAAGPLGVRARVARLASWPALASWPPTATPPALACVNQLCGRPRERPRPASTVASAAGTATELAMSQLDRRASGSRPCPG